LRREVLFVCTGNVFRSLTAEYAHVVPPEISGYLMQKGLDVSRHVRRTLTREIAGRARLLVAMSVDHRDFIRARFGRSAPLFLECCGEAREGLLDLHEAVRDPRASRASTSS
jgi:protein-tyrosine phosphatase